MKGESLCLATSLATSPPSSWTESWTLRSLHVISHEVSSMDFLHDLKGLSCSSASCTPDSYGSLFSHDSLFSPNSQATKRLLTDLPGPEKSSVSGTQLGPSNPLLAPSALRLPCSHPLRSARLGQQRLVERRKPRAGQPLGQGQRLWTRLEHGEEGDHEWSRRELVW